MKEYTIEYHTKNLYEKPVKKGHFELTVMPCHSPYQKIQKIDISHSLKGPSFFSNNKYDFETLHVRTEEKFEQFLFQLRAEVERLSPDFIISDKHSVEEEICMLKMNDFYIFHHAFFQHTTLTLLTMDDVPAHLWRKPEEKTGHYIYRLNQELSRLLQYKTGVSNTKTTAKETLQRGAGVCQDFSHVMIGILRLQEIPARYVSGYLNTKESVPETQLHAWVEVYIPYIGWKGFDTVHQLMEDENYIKIAHGRDYRDCQPIKGILQTEGENQTSHYVKIETKKNNDFSSIQQQQ